MKAIVILISGRGSNMEAIVQRCAAEGWPARIAAVIANRGDAAGLRLRLAAGDEGRQADAGILIARTAPIWWCWPASCASWASASCAATKAGC